MEEEILFKELSDQIVGAAFAVRREHPPGLDEKIYENSLCVEFEHMGLVYSQQSNFPVHYREVLVGTLIPDLIVEKKVIVECKVVDTFNKQHLAQILGYLAITGLKVGYLINFKHLKLEFKRVVRS